MEVDFIKVNSKYTTYRNSPHKYLPNNKISSNHKIDKNNCGKHPDN